MIEIIPAILPQDLKELQTKIASVKDYVQTVQVDFCDGVFVPSRTWPYTGKDEDFFQRILNEEEGMPYWEDVNFEYDLMIVDATAHAEQFLKLGAKRLIFHIEGVPNIREYLEGLDPYVREFTEIGLAINIDTPLSEITPHINNIDFVQCMGIAKIGFQGNPFDPKVIEKVAELHREYPDLVISVDGAVTLDTAPALVKAGATRLTSGSGIFKAEDIEARIREFQALG